ncbi:MAG: glycoside hydrolase family 97 protein [Bacteroidales bacterium]|nr:glycoside hydrolase family 97 protein [Bacteroidales bacterium]
MKRNILLTLLLTIVLISCNRQSQLSVESPDGNIKLVFSSSENSVQYKIFYIDTEIIKNSALGLVIKENDTLTNNLVITSSHKNTYDETWEQPWGEKRFIRNNYNEIFVSLKESSGKQRQINIIFRVFNDGVGYRYEIPEQPNLDSIIITDELTEFKFADNHEGWWIPAYRDNRYEYLYKKSALSEIDTVHTPFTIETNDGFYLSIHEANLTNYASMTLASVGDNTLKCDLVPWADSTKVKTSAPMVTPWRTIQITDKPGDLITSYLILNLNEPNRLDDISWINPVKYMGIWWGMHIGRYTFWESDNQGATTANAKYYIDFASEQGIKYLLIEGWNTGWTPSWYENLLHVFSFTQCANNFSFNEVVDYAKSKKVNIIGYHETGSNLENYLAQIDSAMQMYEDADIHNIKIGQVGSRLQLKEWHHGQFGVEYYRYVLEKAAEHKLTVNFHEPIKPTGLRRTMPNLMTGEGARGQEYNAWSEGNPPLHTCILPFTRLLAGPMDFTPGVFKITTTRVHTTLAKQLALYVIIFSPVQMLADLPENYDSHPAFRFLIDVPVDWEDTKVLEGEIGEYITIVRKDRHSNDWYLGSITNKTARETKVDLSFLEDGEVYIATIYADGEDAEYDKNPESYRIDTMKVTSTSSVDLKLAPGGGCAIQFIKL